MSLKCCSQTPSPEAPSRWPGWRLAALAWPFLSRGWPRGGASSLSVPPLPSSARAEQLLAGGGQT